jgi:AraC-like DNA-binding protein
MPSTPPQLLRFSTEMLPERDRLAAFREEFARQVLNMDVVDRSGRRPRIDISFLNLGPVRVGGLGCTATEFIRDARRAKDGNDDFQLLLQVDGVGQARLEGQDLSVDPGSAALLHNRQQFRAWGVGSGVDRAASVAIPAADLKALVPHPEDRAGHLVRPGPALRLLDSYLASLLALDEPPPAELAHRVGLHLLDLAAAAIGPTAEAGEIIAGRGMKAARQRAVLADIARRFGNPGLGVDGVAGRLGLSRRSVQRLLEETGKSFTEHVTERRLERAYAMLGDRAFAHLRIIDIALAAGFANLSHFNRLFRRRFGETPSGARTNGRGSRD